MKQLIRRPDVEGITGLKASTMYQLIAEGSFPAPFKVGAASYWERDEVSAWIDGLVGRRGADAKLEGAAE